MREIGELFRNFEPLATIAQTRMRIGVGKEVLVLEDLSNPELRPMYSMDVPISG